MFNVFVEGVYESDTGSGQKKFVPFSYDFIISKPIINGINTHVQRRFIPYLISKDKKKADKVFSRLHSCLITDIQEIKDNKNSIVGKDINEMNDWEIQDLACLFDLYEIPLPNMFSINELRDKATIAYLKNVLKVPMETPKDIQNLDFIEVKPDGSFKLNLGDKKICADIPPEYFDKQEKEENKKGLAFFLDKVFNFHKEENNDKDDSLNNESSDDNKFPSLNELMN